MPTESSPWTARRLLALLELLQARRDWPARVLAERLGVSERTVRRDVERLRELDFTVAATRGPDGGYRLEAGDRLPPLLLDEQQAVPVDPDVLLRRGRWYVVGSSPERDDWRVHRVDRIRLRPPHGRRFERREVPGGDAVAFVESCFRGSEGPGWPCDGSALLAVPAADVAAYVGDGAVEAVDDDRCRLRLGSWSWEALGARLLGFGVGVTGVEPAELREALGRLSGRAGAAARTRRTADHAGA